MVPVKQGLRGLAWCVTASAQKLEPSTLAGLIRVIAENRRAGVLAEAHARKSLLNKA